MRLLDNRRSSPDAFIKSNFYKTTPDIYQAAPFILRQGISKKNRVARAKRFFELARVYNTGKPSA